VIHLDMMRRDWVQKSEKLIIADSLINKQGILIRDLRTLNSQQDKLIGINSIALKTTSNQVKQEKKKTLWWKIATVALTIVSILK